MLFDFSIINTHCNILSSCSRYCSKLNADYFSWKDKPRDNGLKKSMMIKSFKCYTKSLSEYFLMLKIFLLSISDVLLWTSSHGQVKARWLAWTYRQQLCADTGCRPEDLSETMDDRKRWQERVRDIPADGATWWWWWCVSVYISVFIDSC